jgi:tRNA (cytidine/uridine-2'-O-)-methyltransferase
MSTHVVLVNPEIHWNTGNAGRSCLAFGAQLHLVKPLGFSLDEREVKRAGLDYWERVSPRVWSNWQELEAALPGLGEPYFLSPDGARTLWEMPMPKDIVLVFGKESTGLSYRIRERWKERLVSIPMSDKDVRALNLSTTVGIALYEVARQRVMVTRPPDPYR